MISAGTDRASDPSPLSDRRSSCDTKFRPAAKRRTGVRNCVSHSERATAGSRPPWSRDRPPPFTGTPARYDASKCERAVNAAPAAALEPPMPASNAPLRPELARLLTAVRARFRRYVALRGLAVSVLAAVGVFWALLWIDDAWFALTRLELPVWLRMGLAGLAAVVLIGAPVVWIAAKLFADTSRRALALAVERRFPDLRGRLVLAVERSEDPGLAARESPFTAALADRAAADAAARVRDLPPGELFDPAPLRRVAVPALALLLGTVGFALWRTDAVDRLRNAYVDFAPVYRVRTTALQVAAVLPPGEEVKPLTPGETHRHPRGADLVLLVSVPTGEKPGGGPWRAPEQVTVERETARGATARGFALPDGPGRFRFALDEVRDGMTLWFSGGDYTDREPYRIAAVDPPRPRRVALSATFPAYTGLNRRGEDDALIPDLRPVRGAKATVPVGTAFDLILEANKPLADARVTVDGEPVPAAVAAAGGGGEAAAVRVPLVMLPPAPTGDEPDAAEKIPIPDGSVGVRPGARVAVELEDADGIRSQSPVRLALAGEVDEPPAVNVEPVGVSEVLTRTASVPFVGTISDGFGVAAARFLYRVTGGPPDPNAAPGDPGVGDEWLIRPFSVRPRGLPERFDVGDPTQSTGPDRDADRDAERFELASLDLQIGQRLTLVAAAEDANDLTGPGEGRGPERSFEIVTDDELLARLFDREVNLRRVFERSLEEVTAVADDLAAVSGETPAADVRRVAGLAVGELSQNAGQAEVVRSGFGEILAELRNNGVQTSAQTARLRDAILEPLAAIADDLFPEADRAAGALLAVSENEAAPAEVAAAADAARVRADRLADAMTAVLREMRDLAEFHEAVQDLQRLVERQEDLLDRTREEQKRDLLDGLFQ